MSEQTSDLVRLTEAERADRCRRLSCAPINFEHYDRHDVERIVAARVAAARADERERVVATNAEVMVLHADIDHDGDEYYCLGCLESLGSATGAEVRWAGHVEEQARATLAQPAPTDAGGPR